MKKGLMILLTFLTIVNYAQEVFDFPNQINCELSKAPTVERHTNVKQINQIRAAGDVIWLEDFSSGVPLGWSLTDDAGIGGWVFIDADTMFTGAYVDPNNEMIQGNTAGGYMHLPADYYNCIPDVWPRQMVASPADIDASIETDWIDISTSTNGLILEYATYFRLCCSNLDTKLDVNVTVDGSNWMTLNGREINGTEIGINELPVQNAAYPKFFIPNTFINGATSLKIQFRMHGGSHYFWSLDDIRLVDPENNDIFLKDFYMGDTVYTAVDSRKYNVNYSSVPGNIITNFKLGALVSQMGSNAENLRVNFDVSIDGGSSVWNTTSGVITNFQGGTDDSLLVSPINNNFYSFNPTLMSDVDYTFTYTVLSDNSDADISDNTLTYPFKQTKGLYSYHWQPTCGADADSDIGPFSYAGITPVVGDIVANRFDMYQETGSEYKIHGLRFFIPLVSNNNVTFDALGNGVTLIPVIFFYDPTANAGSGGYVEVESVTGTPYVVEENDAGTFLYLAFDEFEVDTYSFPEGKYLVGVRILDYNSQRIAIGVDQTYRQGQGSFYMNLVDYDEWYTFDARGSAMIDVYTDLQEFNSHQAACNNVPIANFSSNTQSIVEGDTIFYDDTSTGGIVTSWTWELETASGTITSNIENPYIVYNQTGTYDVTLTVSNAYGTDAITMTDYIEVYQPLSIDIDVTDTYCGVSNGMAIASVSGGSGSYSFLWSTGETIDIVQGLEQGSYTLTVTDNIYNFSQVESFIVSNNTIQVNITGNDNYCSGGSEGSATASITGGQAPYTFVWSNCETTETISNLPQGVYYVTVADVYGCWERDSIIINDPEPISLSVEKIFPTCGNSDGSIEPLVSNGIPPYTFEWSNGVNSGLNANLQAGEYSLTVIDAAGCDAVVNNSLLSNSDSVTIVLDSTVPSVCNGNGEAYISVSDGSGSYSYSWSNGYTTEDLLGVAPGVYTVEVIDGSCKTYFETEIPVIKPITQEICMVTYDTVTDLDLVIWEKIQLQDVDHYNIYKTNLEDGFTSLVGSVDFNEMSQFSVPEVCPFNYSYKMTAVDACGNESDLSQLHKPINISANLVNSGNSMEVIWDEYIGFTYDTYYLYRYSLDYGWELLATLPSTDYYYIDDNYQGLDEIKYSISVEAPNGCTPTSSSKEASNTYYYSSSNIVDETQIYTEIENKEVEEFKLSLFPNPNTGNFILGFNNDYSGTVQILDVSGKLVYTDNFTEIKKWSFDKEIESGIYMVKVIVDNNTTKTIKMIVN